MLGISPKKMYIPFSLNGYLPFIFGLIPLQTQRTKLYCLGIFVFFIQFDNFYKAYTNL